MVAGIETGRGTAFVMHRALTPQECIRFIIATVTHEVGRQDALGFTALLLNQFGRLIYCGRMHNFLDCDEVEPIDHVSTRR